MDGLRTAPEEPQSPLIEPRALDVLIANFKGQNVIIDYAGTSNRTVEKTIRISDKPEHVLRREGYLTAIHFLKGWKYVLTAQSHTFVKFSNLASPPETTNKESSSTLYDYSRSKASNNFIKHLIKIKFDSLDSKRILMIGAIAIGCVLAFFLFGGF